MLSDQIESNWDLLSCSMTLNAYTDTVVNHIPTMLVRTGDGICFVITVPEDAISQISSRDTERRLLTEPRLAGSVVVGRLISGRKDTLNGIWPIAAGDTKLSNHIEKTADHFRGLIEQLGSWQSFSAFLAHDIGYDVSSKGPFQQLPLVYWWLCGEAEEGKPVHVPSVNEVTGTFVRPEDGALPVYTSSLFADMASQVYSRTYDLSLTPVQIACLGCYLHGFSNDVPENTVRTILLNDQWVIEQYVCKEHHGGHFFLSDGNEHRYVLIGCKDKGYPPVWCEKKWDVENRWFFPECLTKG
jgi:hypothetical protein